MTKSRREFIVKAVLGGAAAVSAGCMLLSGVRGRLRDGPALAAATLLPSDRGGADFRESEIINENPEGIEAMYYSVADRNRVRCELCYRNCVIAPGRRGFCRNRENSGGSLYNVVYGRPSAVHVDPVEKEPQHHLLPGAEMLSIGTAGCNFRCLHCHNWHLSQRSIEEIGRYHDLPPRDVVNTARELGVSIISSTYNEPTVFYEYVLDTARIARREGFKILWHSNGYMKPEPLVEILHHTDAVTIDLKGFSKRAYDNSSAELEPVLETLKIIREEGVWLEIVNLVIPGVNDSMAEIGEMCTWIKDTLSPEVPLHLSRFFPNYKLTNLSPTPVATLERAFDTARRAGLDYVTLGNVPGHEYNSTFCPRCDGMLIKRVHFKVTENNISDGRCASCSHPIPGVWS
ncbi:MAG: AmmeMemoRadiSam system radical SAM enzyme [Marinilabiliales bacterium]|nr:MAG: AmmeMemoRadiSam system radical SAM enzyme [Marinilabiliales bacterium]